MHWLSTAENDAAQVVNITKDDMISFYAHHISPSSARRVKLSIWLTGRIKPEKPPLDETKAQDAVVLQTTTNKEKASMKAYELQPCFRDVDNAGKPPNATSVHLREGQKLNEENVATTSEGAAATLGLEETNAWKAESSQQVDTQKSGARKFIFITSIRDFKSRLPVSTGAKPVCGEAITFVPT